ncbi:MAG: glycosyltransferase family 1 protein [Desulfobulbus sp.]|jgi:glycosyltransferase involved in cell wall biosynthesis|nr:MAG: glycosyltransferase family 1 protein [Desulfobulbus sp.]
MNIVSPMPRGNGAYIIHQLLSENIRDYTLQGYNPYWTLSPPALRFLFQNNASADIIHTTPDYGCFFAQKKIPLVLTFHNFVLDDYMREHSSLAQKIHYRTLLRKFTQHSLQMAHDVTSVSHFTANIVQKELDYYGRVRVIYNGVDQERFKPIHRKERRTVKVLFSGNLTRRKGANLLPEIAEKLNSNISILYTSGLRNRTTLSDRQNFRNIGRIPFSAMHTVYQDVDILLFPTVREGFGLAVAEAMACGLPVVATNCSSLPELVVDGKGGYLCKIGDTDEFAQRINELAESSLLRRTMGEFNRERVERKFTLQKMIQMYTDLFTEILDRKN